MVFLKALSSVKTGICSLSASPKVTPSALLPPPAGGKLPELFSAVSLTFPGIHPFCSAVFSHLRFFLWGKQLNPYQLDPGIGSAGAER